MKNILIVTQHFWPERFIINDIALQLKQQGYSISVLTGKPNYPDGNFFKGYSYFSQNFEKWNDIKIYRSFLIPRGKSNKFELFVNYLSFAFFASLRVFSIKEKIDVIFVYQTSPITLAIPAIFAKYKFKAKLHLWVQDLWPDSVSAAGNINSKLLLKLLDFLTRMVYFFSDLILVQSKSFIDYITQQGVKINKIKVLPNTAEIHYGSSNLSIKYKKLMPKGTILMFAGNIGEAQSFKTLVNAAKLVHKVNKEVYWVIIGDGRKRKDVESLVKKYNLSNHFIFLGSYPSDQMPLFYQHADALVFSLKKKNIYSLTIPSKVQSYMASSKPIIASVDGISSKIIKEAKCGFASPAEDYKELANNVITFLNYKFSKKKNMAKNAGVYYEKNFSREIFLMKINSYFNLN